MYYGWCEKKIFADLLFPPVPETYLAVNKSFTLCQVYNKKAIHSKYRGIII